jgi:ATP-dependent helicase/nuclease subunit A
MERHVLRDPESAAVVRVMTIHKSKGLGFDVVILPDLQGKRIDERRQGLAVKKGADRSVEWILDLPPKIFYEADDVLSAYVRSAEAETCYEALSLLYVALTRAKRAMYALIEPVKASVSRNYPKLLTETLGGEEREVAVGSFSLPGLWTSGDPQWHANIATPHQADGKPRAELTAISIAPNERSIVRAARRPSGETVGRLAATKLFSLAPISSAEFGTAVHALLAEVEWGTSPDVAEWRRAASAGAVDEAIACVHATALAEVWREREYAQLWRERAFEIVLDDAWVTGVFDRVIIERNPQGGVQWVTVYDFKTDMVMTDAAVSEAVQRYQAQMNLYRRVAATLAGVPVDIVTCELVFTRLRRRARVAAM